MQRLIEGLQRFKEGRFHSLSGRFTELANGQSPEVLFVTCSDSRVDPSLITQTDPGELFMLRNAGNLIPKWGIESSVDAAVEYAVALLRVKYIVICGHSDCGAVRGALDPSLVKDVPSVRDWVGHIGSSVEATRGLDAAGRLDATIVHNVRLQIENLATHPSVARALGAGTLQLAGWVYDIPSGVVREVGQTGEVAV